MRERTEGAERNVYAILGPPKSHPVPSHRFVVPVCATRCGSTQKGPQSGSRVTERAGKGKIQSSSKLVAKRKIGPHISSWPATTTTAAAAAAAAVAVAATTTKVGHTYKTKDFLCPHCLVDSRSATASNGSERD